MSRYLIDRIRTLPNLTIHVGSEIAALEGDCQTGLTGIVFRDRKDGSTERCAVRYLFLSPDVPARAENVASSNTIK
ncbi:hypothetical protein GWG65_23800 [Bradyrhizobium sp. CSA207]|uniref:hypothetical protein n=1 Tax=Bradyrhizobium sp. CSA207 TaxID=2698826 RepID=UPI0023B0E68F|nr:hypothetical protein [Bradyrhizobium sp. CSA207]MDE5444417.1 hypothetical protein [Bradyrhizobium sp. CSA207]